MKDGHTPRWDSEVEAQLLAAQRECTFMWTNRAGDAFGVVMSYLHRDGKLWLNTDGDKARVTAIRRNPTAAICINSSGSAMGPGKTVSLKGQCTVHEDRELKDWFFSELSQRLVPDNPEAAETFRRFLDGPDKVVIEFQPTYRLGFDSSRM